MTLLLLNSYDLTFFEIQAEKWFSQVESEPPYRVNLRFDLLLKLLVFTEGPKWDKDLLITLFSQLTFSSLNAINHMLALAICCSPKKHRKQ